MLPAMSYSWETQSAASAPPASASSDTFDGLAGGARARARALVARIPRPELLGVMALAAVLNLWDLSRNGWANEYYAAAVRSMSTSWHDFLYASMDRAGVMTVDKPPLALWVQALSVRAFGYHSLSILVPQALMGVASVALVYDLVRRRFGRLGGFIAALALALTPITVAISRHNNPDSLLILCSVAALWCTVRGLENGRTRWLVAAGVCVGLGFETKMLVALVVVPGIVFAWLCSAPAARRAAGKASSGALPEEQLAQRARLRERARWRAHALGQLLAGGLALLIVGGAWPLLVELTPAADRPWVSGTSDNTILSLIFEYNGLGRVDGQAGGPGGTANDVFGGSTGPLRLLNSALGGQAGWLLGFALVSAVAILLASRLRRADARSGWLLAVGGAFATTAVLFSFASGIFHPYYVSLLAPFAAALVGAGASQLITGRVRVRVFGPLAVVVGVLVELVVRADYPGQLTWLAPVLIVVGALAALTLLALRSPAAAPDGRVLSRVRAVRLAATGAALAALLAAPAVWAFDTLGHATSGTFPEGGPASALASAGGPPGGGTHAGGLRGQGGFPGGAGATAGLPGGATGGPPAAAGSGSGAPQLFGSGAGGGQQAGAGAHASGRGGAIGAPVGASVSSGILSYVKHHGGGTIAVESQSDAASAIVEQDAQVAGIGGFSGRESDVSISWLALEVRAGKISWVLEEDEAGLGGGSLPGGGSFTGGGSLPGRGSLPGPLAGAAAANGHGTPQRETRTGSRKAMAAVKRACRAVTLGSGAGRSSNGASTSASGGTLYDCRADAAALERVGARESHS